MKEKKEKMFDLLSKKVTYGLSNEELQELKKLEEAFPEWKDDESFELAAVAINLTSVDTSEKMPAHLRSKILANAQSYIKAEEPKEESQDTRNFERQTETVGSSLTTGDNLTLSPQISFWQKLGWGVAAFACIALAINLYLTRVQSPPPEVVRNTKTTVSPTPAELTDSQKRLDLLTKDGTAKLEIAKADPNQEAEVSGDVVWNNTEQKGYIRVSGLPVNDPNQSTYQMWIFDEERDEKYPIDGGVFDVNKNGEVLIPMNAKLKVKKPKMIAITKEKPGGVVVSDRTGIVAVAKV